MQARRSLCDWYDLYTSYVGIVHTAFQLEQHPQRNFSSTQQPVVWISFPPETTRFHVRIQESDHGKKLSIVTFIRMFRHLDPTQHQIEPNKDCQ